MPRPKKCRKICGLPQINTYGPLNGKGDNAGQPPKIQMTLDEYETIRLIDLMGMTQEDCANQMEVARTTVQAIYNSARSKLARSLVYGLSLEISGGDYILCRGESPCPSPNCPVRQRQRESCPGKKQAAAFPSCCISKGGSQPDTKGGIDK